MPFPGDLHDPGSNASPAVAGRCYTPEPSGKPEFLLGNLKITIEKKNADGNQ